MCGSHVVAGKHGGLMVSCTGQHLDQAVQVQTLTGALCVHVVFLGETLYSHSASFRLGVEMGIGEFNAGGNPAMDYM